MENEDGRKRKAHTKSRRGCANCKLRRVKCDEGSPQCDKCVQYGVQCSYEARMMAARGEDVGTQHSLQLPGEGVVSFSSKPRDSLSPDVRGAAERDNMDVVEGMLGAPVALHETDEKYILDRDDIATLRRFSYRTVCTVGTAQTVGIYREQILKMTARSSCLTHTVLALTLMHDRYIDKPWTEPPSSKEAFHFYHATAIFNRSLSQPIKEEDRDPLWATAALTGCLTIASIDAARPEEAWPLCASSPADLDWLRMSDGKKEVWRLVDPLREGSVFREALTLSHAQPPQPYAKPPPELELLHPHLATVFGVHDPQAETTEPSDNPYQTAASILVRLLNIECSHSSIMYFLSFLGHIDPRYRQLLHAKDPRALLLLAWWYGKMSQYNVWWNSRRIRLEAQAICMYLESRHGDDEDMIKLLYYPKIMTGLIS